MPRFMVFANRIMHTYYLNRVVPILIYGYSNGFGKTINLGIAPFLTLDVDAICVTQVAVGIISLEHR